MVGLPPGGKVLPCVASLDGARHLPGEVRHVGVPAGLQRDLFNVGSTAAIGAIERRAGEPCFALGARPGFVRASWRGSK